MRQFLFAWEYPHYLKTIQNNKTVVLLLVGKICLFFHTVFVLIVLCRLYIYSYYNLSDGLVVNNGSHVSSRSLP